MFAGRQVGRALLVGVAGAVFAAACGSTDTGSASPAPVDVGSGSLTGAGATFPAPFYQKAFFDYSAKYPQVTVNYQSVGSGAGISQFQKGTVDFGASDVPMGDADIAKVPGGATGLVQVPTTLGVISIAYNLSGVTKLQLDGPTLANIFLGHIGPGQPNRCPVPKRDVSPTSQSPGNGLNSSSPSIHAKSFTFRVTSFRPWASAVPATRASPRGSRRLPARSATSSSLTWSRPA